MLHCSSCRSPLRAGVRFCTQCGAPFSAPPSAPPPSASAHPRDEHPIAPPVTAAFASESLAHLPAPSLTDASTIVMDAPVAADHDHHDLDRDRSAALDDARATDAPDGEATPLPVGADVPRRTRTRSARPPAERSTAATWALVTGLAPFVVSVVGNLVGADVGARLGAGDASLASALVVFTIVFVLNAALLTVCGITGGRGIRETANGYTRGRGLAIAGITLGGVNLVLWVAGIVVSVTALAPFLL